MKSVTFFDSTVSFFLVTLISIAVPLLADEVHVKQLSGEYEVIKNPNGTMEIKPLWESSTEYYFDDNTTPTSTRGSRERRHTPDNCEPGKNCKRPHHSTEEEPISDSFDPYSQSSDSLSSTASWHDADAVSVDENKSRSPIDGASTATPTTSNSWPSPIGKDTPPLSSSAIPTAESESAPWQVPSKEEHSQLSKPISDRKTSDKDTGGLFSTTTTTPDGLSLSISESSPTTTTVPDRTSPSASISESLSTATNMTAPPSLSTTPPPSFAHQSKFAIVTGLIIPLSMLAGTSMFV